MIVYRNDLSPEKQVLLEKAVAAQARVHQTPEMRRLLADIQGAKTVDVPDEARRPRLVAAADDAV